MEGPEGGNPGSGGAADADLPALVNAVSAFARMVSSNVDASAMLEDLAERSAAVMEVAGAAVYLLEGRRLVSVAVSRPVLAALGAVQQQHQEGPAVEAVTSGHMITVGDLDDEASRWPHFSGSARAVGVRSVAAVPLTSSGSMLGVMSLYDAEPRAWTVAQLRPARVLADLAGGFLDLTRRLDEQRRLSEQLQRALDSRIIIEQAKGIIAVHREVGLDEAFEILRRHATSHSATLEATADAVVRLGLRP